MNVVKKCYELRVRICELRVTSCELWVASYKLRVAGYLVTIDMILATIAHDEQLLLFSLDTHFQEISRYCKLSLVIS